MMQLTSSRPSRRLPSIGHRAIVLDLTGWGPEMSSIGSGVRTSNPGVASNDRKSLESQTSFGSEESSRNSKKVLDADHPIHCRAPSRRGLFPMVELNPRIVVFLFTDIEGLLPL